MAFGPAQGAAPRLGAENELRVLLGCVRDTSLVFWNVKFRIPTRCVEQQQKQDSSWQRYKVLFESVPISIDTRTNEEAADE